MTGSSYSDWLILSHYKGHQMAGFGGAIKNVGIGASSASGKVLVHTAGTKTSGSIWYSDQDAWLEALAEMVDGLYVSCRLLRGMEETSIAMKTDTMHKIKRQEQAGRPNLLPNSTRKNHAVCLERTDGIEPFEQKRIHHLYAVVPAIAKEERSSRSRRQFSRNVTCNLDFRAGFIVHNDRVIQLDGPNDVLLERLFQNGILPFSFIQKNGRPLSCALCMSC